MPFGAMPAPDVVEFLVAQHMQIRDLLAEVLTSTGTARQQAFGQVLRLLAVHETAEEEVVHPVARRATTGADQIVADRLEEEHNAKKLLEHLDGMEVDDPQFMTLFSTLRAAVLTHATAEQRYEFNRIRQHVSAPQRASMRTLVKAAEATAPTHPHPGVESATKNLLLGPVAAVVDRTRDAVRSARARTDDGGDA